MRTAELMRQRKLDKQKQPEEPKQEEESKLNNLKEPWLTYAVVGFGLVAIALFYSKQTNKSPPATETVQKPKIVESNNIFRME